MDGNEKKKEIVEKGIELFKENGYDNVTVQEIAKACHISKNTFYYYFDNKEDIIRSAFFKGSDNPTGILSRVIQESDPYQQILCLITPVVDYLESLGKEVVKKALILNLGGSLTPGYEPSPEKKQKHDEMSHMINAIITRAQQLGEIRDDIDSKNLIRAFGVTMIGCIQIWATSDHIFSLKEMVLHHMELVLATKKEEK